MAQSWTPQSWQDKPTRQMPDYPDKAALDRVLGQLKTHPPLVFAGEARNLMAGLGQVAKARLSCCRAAIAPKASPNSIPTISATPSACCCRWRWC